MEFPDIDPVIFSIGPLSLNFYSMSYMFGVLIGFYYARYICKRWQLPFDLVQCERFVVWAIFGILIGGRLGYVLLYSPERYFAEPMTILQTYKGGMSFHGGLTGLILSSYLFCRHYKISFFLVTDILAVISPIGIFLGRIANFFNGELYGRITNLPWGVIFPYGGIYPRHPSQLYEAFLEGFCLFIIMYISCFKFRLIQKRGALGSLFLICYGSFRIIAEFFREPDIDLGFIIGNTTMGQLLSIPMVIIGVILYARANKTAAQ